LPDVLLLAAPTKSVPYLFLRKLTYAIAYDTRCAMAFLFYISKKITAGGCASPNSTGSMENHSPAFPDFAGGTEVHYCLYGECVMESLVSTGLDFYIWRDAEYGITSTGRKIHNSSRLNNFAGAEVIPLTGSVSTDAPAFDFWGGHDGVYSTGSMNYSLTPYILPADTVSYLIRGVSDNQSAGYKLFKMAGYGSENLYGEEISSEISRSKFYHQKGGGCGRSISYGEKEKTNPPPEIYEMNKDKKES